MMIVRKGDIHKDRYTTTKQVGVWRHKNYLLCSTFNTALHLINELRKDADLNFFQRNRRAAAPWWNKRLIRYETGD